MQWRMDFPEVCDGLRFQKIAGPFVINYGFRNVPEGRGAGTHGVDTEDVIDTYVEALNDVTQLLKDERFPGIGGSEWAASTVQVYVCDTLELTVERSPFILYEQDGSCYIVLPSRTEEISHEGQRSYRQIVAIHEGTHAFNFARRLALLKRYFPHLSRPPRDLIRKQWLWFDESIALYMEALVRPNIRHCLQYCMYWNDAPEMSLDDNRHPYRGLLFARYLTRTFGVDFLHQVWCNATPNETPVQTISRLLSEKGQRFLAPDEDSVDIFTEYCADSFFHNESSQGSLEWDVHRRFSHRMITEAMSVGSTVAPAEANDALNLTFVESPDKLNHLACRYHRINVPVSDTAFGYLQIRINELKDSHSQTELSVLKGIAVLVANGTKGKAFPLLFENDAVSEEEEGASEVIRRSSVLISKAEIERTDYVILTVANCDCGKDSYDTPRAFDVERHYKVSAAMV